MQRHKQVTNVLAVASSSYIPPTVLMWEQHIIELLAPCTTLTSSLTSPLQMQSGARTLKRKAEVWNIIISGIILHRRVSASATDMRRELHWPTLASRRAVSEAMAVYQSVSGRSPAYLSALFRLSASTYQHATRSASYRGIQVPQVKTEFGKKAFAFKGAQRWNGSSSGQ